MSASFVIIIVCVWVGEWVFFLLLQNNLSLPITQCNRMQARTGRSAFHFIRQVQWLTRHRAGPQSAAFMHTSPPRLTRDTYACCPLRKSVRWSSSLCMKLCDSLCRTTWVKWIMWPLRRPSVGKDKEESEPVHCSFLSLQKPAAVWSNRGTRFFVFLFVPTERFQQRQLNSWLRDHLT